MSEWVLLFRMLRALMQEKECLSVLVTAYRPDVNRQNLLSEAIGENPMFMSFQEYFLGALNREETKGMVRRIGAWKDIPWSDEVPEAVYDQCGGHPLLTRYLASDACSRGNQAEIDAYTVERTATAIRAGFHRHRIANYSRESM